jgi:mRNA interferase RelE/StbE
MAYRVVLRRQAIKALEEIDEPFYSRIKTALYGLADDPRPPGYKKIKGREGYRIRVANYRILYEIVDQVLLVDVIDVGHRKDIYG